MKTLKPCPFCGGKAMFLTITNKPLHSAVGVMFKIKCMKCGTELPKSYECEMYMDQDGGHQNRERRACESNCRLEQEGERWED